MKKCGAVLAALALAGCGTDAGLGLTNQRPVPDVQADTITGDAPLTVNLDASASTDPDGTVSSYEWDFTYDGASFVPEDAWRAGTVTNYGCVLMIDDTSGRNGKYNVLNTGKSSRVAGHYMEPVMVILYQNP